MIKLIRVPGWELKNYETYTHKTDIVVLWAPFHEEGMGLDFDILNIIPPEGKILWNVSSYSALFNGSGDFMNKFVNDTINDSLKDIVQYYWGGDDSGAYFSLYGAMSFFGDKFGLFGDALSHRRLFSMAIPKNSIDIFFDYLKYLVSFFGSSSVVSLKGYDDVDVDYLETLRLALNNEFWKYSNVLDFFKRDLFDAEKAYMINTFGGLGFFPADEGIDVDEVFIKKTEWIVNNYPLSKLESLKGYINTPFWGGVYRSALRNKLRLILDNELSKYPIIQTNPYERYVDPYIDYYSD